MSTDRCQHLILNGQEYLHDVRTKLWSQVSKCSVDCCFWGLPCRLKDKGVGKDAEWGSLLEKPLLRYAGDADSAGLSHFVDIFVERHHLLWKVPRLP